MQGGGDDEREEDRGGDQCDGDAGGKRSGRRSRKRRRRGGHEIRRDDRPFVPEVGQHEEVRAHDRVARGHLVTPRGRENGGSELGRCPGWFDLLVRPFNSHPCGPHDHDRDPGRARLRRQHRHNPGVGVENQDVDVRQGQESGEIARLADQANNVEALALQDRAQRTVGDRLGLAESDPNASTL